MKKLIITLLTLMMLMGVLYTTALADEIDETEDIPQDLYEEDWQPIDRFEVEPEFEAITVQLTGSEILELLGSFELFASEFAFPAGSEPRPFTPSGTGTVIDNATGNDGKEFFTITTADGNVFYLIIDRQRGQDNVYFLNAVTEQDLISLAMENGRTVTGTGGTTTSMPPVSPPTDIVGEEKPAESPANNSDQPSDSNTTLYIIVLAAVVVVGGVAYYFKIVKGKRNAPDDDDFYDDDDSDRNDYESGEIDDSDLYSGQSDDDNDIE